MGETEVLAALAAMEADVALAASWVAREQAGNLFWVWFGGIGVALAITFMVFCTLMGRYSDDQWYFGNLVVGIVGVLAALTFCINLENYRVIRAAPKLAWQEYMAEQRRDALEMLTKLRSLQPPKHKE